MSVSVADEPTCTTVRDSSCSLLGDQAGIESALNYGVIYIHLRHVEATPHGLLIWARKPFGGVDDIADIDNRVDRLLSVTGQDTVELITGKPAYTTTAYYPRCSMTFSMRQPLAPRILWQWGNRVARVGWGVDNHRLVRSVRWGRRGQERPAPRRKHCWRQGIPRGLR